MHSNASQVLRKTRRRRKSVQQQDVANQDSTTSSEPTPGKLSLLSVTLQFGPAPENSDTRLPRFEVDFSHPRFRLEELWRLFTQLSSCVVEDQCGSLWGISITPYDLQRVV